MLGSYDQKHNARKRRNARRASRTFTIDLDCSEVSVRLLRRPPLLPICAKKERTSGGICELVAFVLWRMWELFELSSLHKQLMIIV